MRPAATVALVTAVALFAPAAALATPRIVAPLPGATVAQLAGSPTTPSDTTTTGASAPPDLGPAVALNFASDRTALTAYATYLQSLVKSFPASQESATAYISETSGGCKSALEPLTTSNGQISNAVQTTLTAIGEEIGEDLAINFDTTALDSFSKLSLTLDRLRWSARGQNAAIVKRYVDTQTALSEFAPSGLCADALLAASAPQMVPTATRAFLKQYDKVAAAANNGLTDFLSLLRTYQVPSEQKLVTRIAALAAEINRTAKADLLANGETLTSVLETS
jgi:uncharacterized small protein (DUF1192 family)